MIKAVSAGRDGVPVVILGLSKTNLERMGADRPVKVELSELGLPATTVFLITGDTEEAMLADLQGSLSIGDVVDTKTPYLDRQAEIAHRLRDKLGHIAIERHDQARWTELVAEVMTMASEVQAS